MRFFVLACLILSACLMLGCTESNNPTDDGQLIDIDGSYTGTLKINRNNPIVGPDYREDHTDPVNLIINDKLFELSFISNGNTNLCNIEGDLDANTVTGFITLFKNAHTGSGCDSLRVPDGVFSAVFNNNDLDMEGFRIITDNNDVRIDSVYYTFDLTLD